MQVWLLVFAVIIFILSSATTFIQVKRRAFILTCLGVTGQLFSFAVLLGSSFIPKNTEYAQFQTSSKVICCITGFILAAQQISSFTVSLALSIELYIIFYKRQDVGKNLRFLLQVLCLGIPYLSIILNILVVVVGGGQAFVPLMDVGLCEVPWKIKTNEWAILIVRGIPEYTPIFPAFILSVMAVLPLALRLFKTQSLRQPNSHTIPRFESGLPSAVDTPRSNKRNSSSNSSTAQQNLAAAVMKSDKIMPRSIAIRMSAWCFIVSCIGIPISLMGLIEYFHLINDSFYQNPLNQSAQLCLGLGTHFLIFLVFATGKYAYEQYQHLWLSLLHGWQRLKKTEKPITPKLEREIPIEIVEHGKIITSEPTDPDSDDETLHREQSSTSKELTFDSSTERHSKSADNHTDDDLQTEKESSEVLSPTFTRLSGGKKPSLLNSSIDNPPFPSAFGIPSSPPLTMSLTSPGQLGNSVSGTEVCADVSVLPSPPAHFRIGTSPFPSRISTSQERHSWLTKPPARSISPDGLNGASFWLAKFE